MRGSTDVDYILSDCFLAVGQAVGPGKTLELDTVIWWHRRYREAFHYAVTAMGACWTDDRRRMTAVGRHLGQRVAASLGRRSNIDRATAERISVEVERGCQLRATHVSGASGAATGRTSMELPL